MNYASADILRGRNLSIDVRWPRGSFEKNPDIALELVRGNPHVIVAWTTPAVIAARRATATVPNVMASVSDPVEAGLIREFGASRPEISPASVL